MNKTVAPKSSRRRHALALSAVVLVPLFAGGFVLRSRGSDEGVRVFQEVLTLVQARAVDSVPEDSLYQQAARGLLRSLGDPYAELFSPQELASFSRESLRGSYGGLGVMIEQQDDGVTITKVYPNTPAEQGGVQAGDRIVAIEGVSAVGWKLDQVSDKLMGPAGTPVNVTFRRYGVTQPINSRFIRRQVHVPAVPYALMLEGNVGYVPLQQFSNTSGEETQAAIEKLKAQGAQAFILDLRGNSGGSVNQSVQVSNLFLRQGQQISTVRYRNQPNDVYVADKPPVLAGAPLIVLADGYAASASEIVAGSLQDHDRALIVGTTTFGKGLVQDLYPLDGGWAVKLTTGKWYTPSGRSIQRPRKLLPNGQLVVDSATIRSDSVRGRPTYHSDSGRTVYGGGGVTPDVVVKNDTLSKTEQAFMASVAPKAQATYRVLDQLALELRGQAGPSFTVLPAWRETFFQRLVAAGVPVQRAQYDSVQPLITRLLEERIATVAQGDSAAFRRGVRQDPQLMRALSLLNGVQGQPQLFAKAAATARPGETPSAGTTAAAQPAAKP
ncbi:MAG TPA: S41 family peptidase [Longimicrobiaceae bacterium]|jgi:carboxyl-terminal processing protease|nr:S41 family peptidase [Longimicrobiaceae bacterium]